MNTEELKRLASEATPGPWIKMEVGEFDEQFAIADENGISLLTVVDEDAVTFGAIYSDEDAAYIACANPAAILSLIAERDELAKHLEHAARFFDQLKKEDADRYRTAIAKCTGESS